MSLAWWIAGPVTGLAVWMVLTAFVWSRTRSHLSGQLAANLDVLYVLDADRDHGGYATIKED